MNVLEQINSNYNYYPHTAIELCVISYEKQEKINMAVTTNTNLNVVWGPAQLTHSDGIAYSLMFVASNTETGEYFVVIRGTNFDSLSSWLEQDFKVGSAKPFSTLPGNPPNAPVSALISQGTFNGMSDLISLTDPGTGQSVIEYLGEQQPLCLYVTGHSLGGTLTPPFFAYLNAMLYRGNSITNMALWSFAGLTPGGTGFNDYFNSIFPNDQGLLWRIQNSLDIAPFLWYSQADVQNIYISPYNLEWSAIEKDSIEHLFKEANLAEIGYKQPQASQVISGQFDTRFLDDHSWLLQAFHQHHSSTYKQLVNGMYPI